MGLILYLYFIKMGFNYNITIFGRFKIYLLTNSLTTGSVYVRLAEFFQHICCTELCELLRHTLMKSSYSSCTELSELFCIKGDDCFR